MTESELFRAYGLRPSAAGPAGPLGGRTTGSGIRGQNGTPDRSPLGAGAAATELTEAGASEGTGRITTLAEYRRLQRASGRAGGSPSAWSEHQS